MFTFGSRLAFAGILVLMLLGPTACGGAGGGAGPTGSGQGLELLRFSEAAVDNTALNCILRLDFSEAVDASTITGSSIQVRQGPSFGVTAPGAFRVDGATVWFEPRLPGTCDLSDAGFTPNTQYRVQVIGAPGQLCVRNTSGQPLSATKTYEFHTLSEEASDLFMDPVPSSGPLVTNVSPADGSQAVAVDAGNAVVLEFSENLHPCSIDVGSVRFLMCETGDPLLQVPAPNQRVSGFAVGSDTSDQSPSPYSWGTPGTTSLMPDPQVIPASMLLEQSFTGTTLRIEPSFGRFPENALIVVELTFEVEDLGHQALTPFSLSFTTENRPREQGSYLIDNEGETPYDDAFTTAKVNEPGICPSKVQGFLLFAGDGDNGTDIEDPTAPEDNPPTCSMPRQVNDGLLDHFSPTEDVVLDTGGVLNSCPNLVDGSTAVVWEFASFYIGPGITVRITGVNPAIILVRGDVIIDAGGRLLLAGGDGQDGKNYPTGSAGQANGGVGVAGGGDGGDAPKSNGTVLVGEHGYVGYGSPDFGVVPQGGHGAGHGNASVTTTVYTTPPASASGGGGGHATPGAAGSANTSAGGTWLGALDGSGGGVYPVGGTGIEKLPLPSAGSGGGAAGWCRGASSSTYYLVSGGGGGAGGGFVDITSNGNIKIYGTIDASGGDGGAGSFYYSNHPVTGGGGGGSGGGIRLLTPNSIDVSAGTLDCGGGSGGLGAVSTYTGAALPNDGGDGGRGRIVLEDGDSIIAGLGGASVTPGEGQPGFYRGVFDAGRFAGGGLTPVAVSEPILVGAFDPEYLDPKQTYGGQQDFRVGLPTAAAGAPGDIRMLIEARGYELQRDGTPGSTPSVAWHTVGYFTSSGQDTMPTWNLGQVGAGLQPPDNVGDGISNLNGCEYIQIRITFFLPDGFGVQDAGSYLDDWIVRFEADQ